MQTLKKTVAAPRGVGKSEATTPALAARKGKPTKGAGNRCPTGKAARRTKELPPNWPSRRRGSVHRRAPGGIIPKRWPATASTPGHIFRADTWNNLGFRLPDALSCVGL